MERVRRALGRTTSAGAPPEPPALPEQVVRLVHTDIGLPELFAKRAEEQKMGITFTAPDDLADQIVTFLRDNGVKRLALSGSKLFESLGVYDAVRRAGFDAKRWSEITLDQMYDFDCAITDTTYAVAETGSLVIVTDANNGRALSLVPMYHVAVVEPKNLVPDLLDLFKILGERHRGRHVVMISGPSKTADIEMNVVTGVHGPHVVQAFVLK
jgi:L-lactate dehydrogenase complex protein LldG